MKHSLQRNMNSSNHTFGFLSAPLMQQTGKARYLLLTIALFMGANTNLWAAWSGSGSAVSGSGTTWYVVNQSSYEELNTIETGPEISLSGPGSRVTYEAKGSSSLFGGGVKYFQYLYYDGSWHNSSNQTLTTSYKSYSFDISSNVTKIKFRTVTGSTNSKNVRNIKVTMAQYIENPSSTSLTCAAKDINTTTPSTASFTIAWCNVPAMTFEWVNNPNNQFSYSISNNAEFGKYNTATITVSYSHTVAGTHTATLRVKDTYGNYQKDITITGTTNKLNPEITWTPDLPAYNVEDEIVATSADGLTVTMSADGYGSYVTCQNNMAVMTNIAPGNVTIKASVAGNNIYNSKEFTKTFTITNKTKQTITWEQRFNKLKTTDATKSIELTATASSGMPVTYTLSGDKTGVSLSQNGGKWYLNYSAVACSNTLIIASRAGNDDYTDAPSYSLPVKVIDPNATCSTAETLVASSNPINKLTSSRSFDLDIPATITINVKRTNTKSWAWYTGEFKAYIYDANGTELTKQEFSPSDINSSRTITFSNVNVAATKLTLVSEATTYGYDVTSVTYTHQQYCNPSVTSLDFTTPANTLTSEQPFNINYANYMLEVSTSSEDVIVDTESFGDCGDYGTQTIKVKYRARAISGNRTEYVYIKDNTGVTRATITLNISISKVSQSITSTSLASSYNTTDKITLSPTANSGLTAFTYTASPSGVAQFNGNVMTFLKSCDNLSITITQPGNEAFEPASTTVQNIVVNKVTPTIATLPSAGNVSYLANLNTSALSGGAAEVTYQGVAHTAVPGTFTWTSPATINDAQGVHNYQATFTPTNTAMYDTATCNVPVTVLRTTPTMSMSNATTVVSDMANNRVTTIDLREYITLPTAQPMSKESLTYTVKSVTAEGFAYSAATTATGVVNNTNHTFYASEAGVYTLTATTPQTNYYNSRTIDFTVTVNKRPNTITVHGSEAYSVDIYTDGEANGLTIASTNPSAERPISCTQTAGADIVSFNRNEAKAYSNYHLGTATWHLEQSEDAYYQPDQADFTVNVITVPQTECDLFNDGVEYTIETHIYTTQGTVSNPVEIPNGQYAKELYVMAKRETILGVSDNTLQIEYSTDGSNFTTIASNLDMEVDNYKTFGPFPFPEGAHITHLRANAPVGATGIKHFKFIVKRKAALAANDLDITKTANNLPIYVNQTGVGTLAVDWSIVGGGDLKLISTNPKFTLSQTTIEGAECNNGRTNVTISYRSATAGTDEGKIIIYNRTNRIEVNVTGTTLKTPQTINWYVNDVLLDRNNSLQPVVHVGDIITARTNNNFDVTFLNTSDPDILSINPETGVIVALAEGTASITARGEVEPEVAHIYNQVNETLTFDVTEDIIQTIHWNQSLLGLVQGDADVTLNAYATWTDEDDNIHQRPVTYTVADPSIAEVINGNTLHILTNGNTTITAIAQGGEENDLTFMEAMATKKIIVRDPNAPCDGYIFTQTSEEKRDCGYNLTTPKSANVIFELTGQPRTCNFDYSGAAQVVFFKAGTVTVSQYIEATDTWQDIRTLPAYSKDSYTNSGDIELDYRATKIKVAVTNAVGYFYVNNMQVTLARYFHTDIDQVNFGEQYLGTSTETPDPIVINYSNIQGSITVTSDNPAFIVEESKRVIEGACGDIGTATFKVTYKPTALTAENEEDQATITITDGASTATVNLSGRAIELPSYHFNGGDAHSETDWDNNSGWSGDQTPTLQNTNVVIENDVELSSSATVYSVTINEDATVTIKDGGVLNIAGGYNLDQTFGNLVIEAGGQLVVRNGGNGNMSVNDFTLHATAGGFNGETEVAAKSGQVSDINRIAVNGNKYFVIRITPESECTYGWYDFTVPFPVDALHGITRSTSPNGPWEEITNEQQYAIIKYYEDIRSTGSEHAWKKERGTLLPGQLYSITVNDEHKTYYRFKMKENGAFNTAATETLTRTTNEGVDEAFFGWNGIGNGTTNYITINNAPSEGKVFMYDHAENVYRAITTNNHVFVVGSGYLVKAPENGFELSYTANSTSNNRTLRAPERDLQQVTEYELTLTQNGKDFVADRFFFSADDKEPVFNDTREIIKLTKSNLTDSRIAQMWTNAYGKNLCDYEAAWINNSATVALNIFTPTAGLYTIDVNRENLSDYETLYLTINGTVAWNLSLSACEVELPQGTSTEYGLLLTRQAPTVATGVDNIQPAEDDTNRGEKLILNDQLYVLYNGVLYDAQGKRVK